MTRTGILGGTFDPIHRGHLDVGVAAQETLRLDTLLLMPGHQPPHRPIPIASAFHRFAMVAAAIPDRAGWQASDLELLSDDPSYTATTLLRLHEQGYEPGELFFVTGADAFAGIERWKDFPALLEAAHFVAVSRPGHPAGELRTRLPALAPRMVDASSGWRAGARPSIILINARTADVSSTAIRARCAGGQSIADLVPPAVQEHIERHGLYASTGSNRRAVDSSSHPAAGRLHGQS